MSEKLIGQAALRDMLKLRVPPPFMTSTCGPGARKIVESDHSCHSHFPPRYMPEDTLVGHLRFAIRHETLDTGVLAAAFKDGSAENEIAAWVRDEPNGAHARRAWFLYETLTNNRLDVPDAGVVTYVDALDKNLHVVAEGRRSPRHKVLDNLLGGHGYCPTVRRTERIIKRQEEDLSRVAQNFIEQTPQPILERAVRFLYTKETKSSFEIEHEKPTQQRAQRFITSLQNADSFDPTSIENLVELQHNIVDPRFAATGLRDFQNFIGETLSDYRQKVHFICPQPQDLPDLLNGWSAMTRRMSTVDPVVAAALISSGYVYLHIFEDGNGRISRFLIHSTLVQRDFTPKNTVFPISAAILRDQRGYDAALESFSKPLFDYIEWRFTPNREIEVLNETADLYRYFDATPMVEFMFDKVAETITTDLKHEIEFVRRFDHAISAVKEVVDMPDKDVFLLARLIVQNGGTLSKTKRDLFPKLTDHEIESMQKSFAEFEAEDATEMEAGIHP